MKVPERNTATWDGDYLVRCGNCDTQGLRSRMVWQQVDAPGFPRKNLLVHYECWDRPNPRANRPRPRPLTPPDHIQWPTAGETVADQVETPAVSSVTSPISPGVATDITVTGTGFTQYSRGRVNRQHRPTTYVSATQLTLTIYATDAVSGASLVVDVQSMVVPSDGSTAYSGDATVTVS